MPQNRLLVSAALALVFASLADAAVFEVAQRHPQASDDGPGTSERPWKTISRATTNAAAGDTVVIRGGIYRERVFVKSSGTASAPIRFEAAPGEHVVVTGADQLTSWLRGEGTDPVYRAPWPHRFIGWNKSMTHPDDEYHRLIGRCEQVFIHGYALRQVLASNQLAPGTFFADVTNKALFVRDIAGRDPNKTFTEASVRQEIFRVEGEHVQLRGLHFRYAANMAQHGAVVLAGNYDVLEDCVAEGMNSSGATFSAEHIAVRRSVFRENGQLGFGTSRAHHLLFADCLVENNNTKDFSRGWEAGGCKLVLSRDVVLERSRFLRNRGNGVWFDIGNDNCTVRQCLIADNEDAGIFYEISYGLHAQDNVIVRNGFAATAGAWGAQAGVSLSSSPDCVIERNLIVGNREGFNFREQQRTTPRIDDKKEIAVWNHDEIIRHNIIALNRDAQVWGWFDVKDNRHWPSQSGDKQSAVAIGAKPGDIAAEYSAKTSEGQPTGLTLERLRLSFSNNVYFAGPGQVRFNWGPSWARNKRYSSLEEFQKELAIDVGGRVADTGFADANALDFRVKPGGIAELKNCYPNGPVPGVVLGERR